MGAEMDMGYQDYADYASNAGRPAGQELLESALRMKSGLDGDRDMNTVIGKLEAALDNGSAEAARQLAMCYAYGDGVPQNDAYATMYYRRGAEQGDAECMYRLFRNLSTGKGCEADLDEADTWLKKAADAGHASAKATLERFEKAQMLGKDLVETDPQGKDGSKSIYIERVSAGNRLNLDKIGDLGEIKIHTDNWSKLESSNSTLTLWAVYIAAGIISGILLKPVYENNISFMGSLSLISNFNSAGTFMAYMSVIGGLLGAAIGFLIIICFLERVKETLILYIPVLLMPLIIMCLSSMIMGMVKGVFGLVLGILQIAVYVVVGYTVVGSTTNG